MEKLVALVKKPVTWTTVATVALGLFLDPMHVATLVGAVVSLVLAVKESGLLKKVFG